MRLTLKQRALWDLAPVNTVDDVPLRIYKQFSGYRHQGETIEQYMTTVRSLYHRVQGFHYRYTCNYVDVWREHSELIPKQAH